MIKFLKSIMVVLMILGLVLSILNVIAVDTEAVISTTISNDGARQRNGTCPGDPALC